jgi:hypothetical protein
MLRYWLKPSRFAAVVAVVLLLLAWASLWTYFGPLWEHHRAMSRLAAAGVKVRGSRGDDWMTESNWPIARRWAPTIAHLVDIDGDSEELTVSRQLQLLANVHDLRHVRLTGVPLVKEDWERLARLDSVESVELSGVTVTGQGLTELARLPRLDRLDLSAAQLDDGALLELANCAKLKRVNVPASLAAHPDVAELLAQRGDIDIVWIAKLLPEERAKFAAWERHNIRLEGRVSHGTGPRRWIVGIGQPPTDMAALLNDLRPLGVIEQFEFDVPAVTDELVIAAAKATLGTERIGITGGALTAETLQSLGECATLRWLTLRQVSVPRDALQMLRSQPKLFVELLD